MGETDADRPSGASSPDGFWDASRCVGTLQCLPRCPRFVSKDGCGFVVRPYDDADRGTLAEMYCDYGPDARLTGLLPTDEAHITEWLSNLVDHGHNFITVANRGIIGHAAYVAGDDPEPELAAFIHQDSHGRGIGTELCRHIVADAVDTGREALVLHVAPDDQRAVHVYRKPGFETVSSGDAGTKMRLDLMPPVPSATRSATGTGSRG